LATALVNVGSRQEQEALARVRPQILEELNVKDLQLIDNPSELDKDSYVISSEGSCSVAVPTAVSPELHAEGMAREIVHRLQIMRRSAGFDIADYIATYYQGEASVKQVIETFADYIKQETLSRQIVEGVPEEDAFSESCNLDGYEVRLAVRKLA